MNIRELKDQILGVRPIEEYDILYLIFGGQDSLYIEKLDYDPENRTVKLLDGHHTENRNHIKMSELLQLPDYTEILIEGWEGEPGWEWYSPNDIDIDHDQKYVEFSHYTPEDEEA